MRGMSAKNAEAYIVFRPARSKVSNVTNARTAVNGTFDLHFYIP